MQKLKSTILLLFTLGILSYTGYSFYVYSLDPCDKPLHYKIGRFDTQFGISEADFKYRILSAEIVWEKALGREIFVYDEEAEFNINLIYDERQLTTVQKQKTEFGLSAIEDVFKKLDAEFNLFKSEYDQKVSVYEQALSVFQSRKSAYDAEVASWNSKGGAPKGQYEALETERRYLNGEAERLNREASSINGMSNQLNILLKERNLKAAQYNKVAENYNKKYGGGLEFNQAEYIGGGANNTGEINVYQFGNNKDLILAMAHELGHALGMNHTENPKSVMYYSTGVNVGASPVLSAEDLAELQRVCKLK